MSQTTFPYKGFEITISDENNDGVYGYTVSKDGEECVFMSETFNSFDEAKKAAKKHVTRGLVFMEGRSAKRARRRHQSRTKVTYWREDLETGGWTASFEDGQSIFEIVLVPEGNRWYWSIYRDGREVQEGDYLDTLNLATILRILENKVKGMSRTYSRRRQSIRGFDNYPEGHGRIKGRDYVIDPVTYDWRFVKYDYSTQDWVTDTSKRTHQGTATSEEDALNQIKNVLGMGGDWYQQMDPSVYSKRAMRSRRSNRRQANYTVRVIWEGELLSQQGFSDENEAYDHFDEMIDVIDRESDPSGTTVQIIQGDNVLGERHFAKRAHPAMLRKSSRTSMEKTAEDFGPIASLWNGRAKAAYRRGWRASQNDWGNTLEKADLDGRADCDYWYSGYMDSSTGRDMWELVADDGSMYVRDGHTCSYCKA